MKKYCTGSAALAVAATLMYPGAVAAYDLVPNATANARFADMEDSIWLYDGQPYSISEAVTKNEVAGMSIVIIYDGKPAIHKWYGYRHKGQSDPTDANTFYQCASMSKMVAAFGLVAADRRGDLSLDESVTTFNSRHGSTLIKDWVDKVFKDEPTWPNDITPRRLLNHTAGLNKHGIGNSPPLPSNDPLRAVVLGSVAATTKAVRPIHEPGTKADYSGGGFTVAEAMLEIATNRKFKDYLRDNVLMPYGMTNSTFEDARNDMADLARGCSRGICVYDVLVSKVKAAGGLLCHPVDYARLVALMLNDGREYLPSGYGTPIIPEDDVVQVLTELGHKDSSFASCSSASCAAGETCVNDACIQYIDRSRYGLGVGVSRPPRSDGLPRSFQHGGAQHFARTKFFADRALNVGIVVMINGTESWVENHEEYGSTVLRNAVIKAFEFAFNVKSGSGRPLSPRCIDDDDCGSEKYCDKGEIIGIGENECVDNKERDESCTRDSMCASPLTCWGKPFGECGYTGTLGLGASCIRDGECISDSCNTDGECQCKVSGDCGSSNQYCDTGTLGIGQNECKTYKTIGETCSADKQCKLPAECMGAPPMRCVVADSRALGQSCWKDVECTTGSCNTNGVCQCKVNSDCSSSNEYCDTGTLGIGVNQCKTYKATGATCSADKQCRPPAECSGAPPMRCVVENSKHVGQSCWKDIECKSGSCNTNGVCQCKVNSDCGSSNQYCDTGTLGIGINQCKTYKATGATCSADKQCRPPAECAGAPPMRCVVKNSKNLGVSCWKDVECRSGKCEGGQCVCTKDRHCGSGRKCKKPLFGKNYCK